MAAICAQLAYITAIDTHKLRDWKLGVASIVCAGVKGLLFDTSNSTAILQENYPFDQEL